MSRVLREHGSDVLLALWVVAVVVLLAVEPDARPIAGSVLGGTLLARLFTKIRPPARHRSKRPGTKHLAE